MNVNVTFLPSEMNGLNISDTICIVLDIFRATTSITTAMANGCKAIYPVLSVEEAHKLAADKKGCLLAGERKSLRIEGFHLGNSPYDFSAETVKGREVIMTTTNGTVAIKSTEGSYKTFIGSFLNAEALSCQVKQYQKEINIVCAGTDRQFSLEDALCAGYLADLLESKDCKVTLTDAAYAAKFMYNQAKDNMIAIAKKSKNGMRLYELNREADVTYCFRKDVLSIVPIYSDGVISL